MLCLIHACRAAPVSVLCGLPSVMEHPRHPRQVDRCSIWWLPLLRHDRARLELLSSPAERSSLVRAQVAVRAGPRPVALPNKHWLGESAPDYSRYD